MWLPCPPPRVRSANASAVSCGRFGTSSATGCHATRSPTSLSGIAPTCSQRRGGWRLRRTPAPRPRWRDGGIARLALRCWTWSLLSVAPPPPMRPRALRLRMQGPRLAAARILSACVHEPPVAKAAHEPLRRIGVAGVPRRDAPQWTEFAAFGRSWRAKSWLNAWVTSRRMRDSRPLPCAFRCGGGDGASEPDDVSIASIARPSGARGGVGGGGPGRAPVDRLALGDAEEAERMGDFG